VNPWNRSDGAALALALLKDLGDAMMKKMDITNPKRPGAQQTQQARIEVYGRPGSASASLPSRVELVRSVGGVQAEIPMEQALHLIASALVPETAAKETAFSRCLRLAAAVKEDLLICAGVLEDSGFPRWEGLIAAATFAARSITRHRAELTAALLVLKQWGWLERVKCALQHQESIERNEFTRAEIAKSIQDLCEATSWTDIRKRGARRTPESLRLGSWHLVASTRPRLVQRTPLTTVKYDEDRSQVANGDNDDELPLVQMGALPGETIYCGARTLVLEKGTVAASASACEEQGLVVASTAAETSSRPERFLGQTCDCSGRSCACPAAIIRERRVLLEAAKQRGSARWKRLRCTPGVRTSAFEGRPCPTRASYLSSAFRTAGRPDRDRAQVLVAGGPRDGSRASWRQRGQLKKEVSAGAAPRPRVLAPRAAIPHGNCSSRQRRTRAFTSRACGTHSRSALSVSWLSRISA
jgi:hypothetical protein